MRTALLLILPLTAWTSACTNWEPPAQGFSTGSGIFEDGSAESSTGWQVPPRSRDDRPLTTTTGVTGITGATTAPDVPDPGSESGAAPPSFDPAVLQIVEVHPDPAGKDGGLESPEFVEILHIGAEPVTLASLEILARAWPVLDAEDLGLADAELAPGQRLVIRRHASAAELPAMTPEGDALQVAFVSDSGLRNSDGAVLLRSGEQIGDLMIYGATQPAPWDSAEAWLGPPATAPGSGVSLCRVGALDHDDADDWTVCPPTPGLASVADEAGTTGTSTGDPGTTGEAEPAEPAEVVIVEVLSNPPGPGNAEKYAEFVEIINLGPGTIDLADWTIADSLDPDAAGIDPLLYRSGDGGCVPNTCLAPGQRALLVGNLYDGDTGDALVLMTDDTTLANGGLGVVETVAIRDGAAVIRSTYRAWPDPLVEPNPTLTEQALVRADPSAQDTPAAWTFAAPSPGG